MQNRDPPKPHLLNEPLYENMILMVQTLSFSHQLSIQIIHFSRNGSWISFCLTFLIFYQKADILAPLLDPAAVKILWKFDIILKKDKQEV